MAIGWMDTTDGAGGFKQMHHFPKFRCAVSENGRLDGPVEEVCPPPKGWRIATAAELRAACFAVGGAKMPVRQYYYNQAGWHGYNWRGVDRYWFVTADWTTVEPADGGAVNVGQHEGELPMSADSQFSGER